MRALGAEQILELWERARGDHPVDQALALLAAAAAERSRDDLAAMPLGRRDALLLALRAATFGDRLPARSRCPDCDEEVEFELACSALRAAPTACAERVLETAGYELRVRPLNSADLAAAARQRDAASAHRVLLARAVVAARRAGAPLAVDGLPASVCTAVADAVLAADPQAELLIELGCPACGHGWQAMLDIAQLLWAEIGACAQRLLMEVHALARAYGWRESEILALSPARRAAYLQMVGP